MAKWNDRQRERKEKRLVKKVGNKARRRALKRSLEENPEDAESDDYHFKVGESSKEYNQDPDEKEDYECEF